MYIVVNNTVTVNVGQAVIAREDVRVSIDCGQLIDDKINSGVQNPTVNWYKEGAILTTGSAINVEISMDSRLCVITDTLLPVGGQLGTDGNYTCEVCGGTTDCTSKESTQILCGKTN